MKRSTLLAQLQAEDLLSEAEVTQLQATPLPAGSRVDRIWYVQLLMGTTAWISASIFISFIGLFASFSEVAMTIVGPMMIGAAISIMRWRPNNAFISQLTLATVLAGQLLFVFGLGELIDTLLSYSVSIIALISIGIQLLLLWTFPSRFYAFLAPILIWASCAAIIGDVWSTSSLQHTTTSIENMFIILNVIWMVLILAIWWFEESLITTTKQTFWPTAALGATTVLTISIAVITVIQQFELLPFTLIWLLSLTAGAITLIFIRLLLQHYQTPPASYAILIFPLLLLVPAWHVPGIILGFAIILFGIFRQRWLMISLGIVSLFLFMSFYYYTLHWTLLNKSILLMALGGIMLVGRQLLLSKWSPPHTMEATHD
ncbi:MAG TPA: DUF4401 domain-containing protein [Anaerolineae bacterium]|nr:DUF4401 domain-containing protein [Anaerolineae bacterium]